MFKKRFASLLTVVLLLVSLSGCEKKEEPAAPVEPAAKLEEAVTLTVAGGWPDCRALDVVAKAFTERYPNCTVVYEYVQDYYPSLVKRMAGSEPFDLFFTSNIQEGSEMLPYALELLGGGQLHLDDTFEGLIQNFAFRGAEGDPAKIYAIPLGAEMRGLYINKTLLDSLGIAVPTNQDELLAACQTLKENGYIAFHGNPGDFAQTLLYPWICNLIANADDPEAAYARVNSREPGVSEMFREPYEFLYTLVENGYYDYKRVQTELGMSQDASDDGYARDFLNIRKQGDEWVKTDDVGVAAFMPGTISMQSIVAKMKDDYHSGIEYIFTIAPIGKEGGFVYLSPAHGMAVGNSSKHQEWALRFMDFLFEPETNETFAKVFNIIPNTKDAFAYIRTLFDVPDNRISHLGQVTFGYGFYNIIQPSMVDMSKGNNPKYMKDDGNGNLSLYPMEYYFDELERGLQEQ